MGKSLLSLLVIAVLSACSSVPARPESQLGNESRDLRNRLWAEFGETLNDAAIARTEAGAYEAYLFIDSGIRRLSREGDITQETEEYARDALAVFSAALVEEAKRQRGGGSPSIDGATVRRTAAAICPLYPFC